MDEADGTPPIEGDAGPEAEQQVPLSGALLAALSELGEGVVVIEDGRIVYVNEAVAAAIGYTPDELLALPSFMSLLVPEMRPIVERLRERPDGVVVRDRFEATVLHQDGHRLEIDVATKRFTVAGRRCAVALIRDITARKAAEDRLRRAAERAEALLRIAARINAVHDLDTVIRSVCDETARVLPVDFVSVSLYDPKLDALVPAHWSGLPKEMQQQIQALPAPLDHEFRQAYGPVVVTPDAQALTDLPNADVYRALDVRTTAGVGMLYQGELVGRLNVGTVGATREFSTEDLALLSGLAALAGQAIANALEETQRRRAEEALRLSEASLANAQHLAHLGSWELELNDPDDLDAGTLCWSDEVYRIFGYEPCALAVSTEVFYRAVHPDDRARVRAAFAAAIRTGQRYDLEHRIVRPDGSERIVHERSEVVADPSTGRHIRIVGTVQDITERKQAEAALRTQTTRYESLLRAQSELGEGVVIHEDERIVFANEATCLITGYSAAELKALSSILDLVAPEERAATRERSRRRLAGEPVDAHYESTFIRKDGSRVRVYHSATLLQIGERRQIVAILRDITGQRQLEEQFLQAQKMEAVGRLAGGVAHDFNNMLGVILGYADLALMRTDLDAQLRHALEQMYQAAERSAALTQQLLAFSRKQIIAPQVVDLNDIVRQLQAMLQRVIGEDIALETHLGPNLDPVSVDPGQIQQVLVNLSVNARDAMPEGGRLTIETANVGLTEEARPPGISIPPGDYVALTVADTGHGMDAATQAHIFEPFFTTKEVGLGTGLGLATVYGIVQQSRGFIAVYSAPREGARFTIYLPRCAGTGGPAQRRGQKATSLRGTETILLVEDEAALRSMLAQALRQNGYTVIEAANGEEAVQACARHDQPIHLLVADIVMPELSGRALQEWIAAIRPEIEVLFITGYTDDALVRHGVREAGVPFLQKPFTAADLIRKVQEILKTGHPT